MITKETMKKLSLKSSSSNNNNPSKHYITQFDPSQTIPTDDSVAKLAIPPLQNQWKPLNTMNNSELLPTIHPNNNNNCNGGDDDDDDDDGGGEDIKTVEGYAEAGYGWSKGMGIGRRTREDVKVWQPKRWRGREGFGFVSDDRSRNLTRRRICLRFDFQEQTLGFRLL